MVDYQKNLYAESVSSSQYIFDNTLGTGALNELLRKQLSPDLPTQQQKFSSPAENLDNTLLSLAVDAIDEILNNTLFERTKLHSKLSALFYMQKDVYLNTPIEDELRRRQFISHCGLVMSPDNCITTQLDDIRVRSFVRGVHSAIQQKMLNGSKIIRVVYPACGPFAPLLMPLLGYYKARSIFSGNQLQVTFIDIQPGATKSLAALVEHMGINEYIQKIYCMDATEYENKQGNIDIVLLEAMQHGFSREGQLSIARHFVKFLSPNGNIIPQKITVSAHIISLQEEFVEQWCDVKSLSENDMNAEIKQNRIQLGDILTVTLESLLDMQERVLDENTALIECGTVQVPDLNDDSERSVILSTRVQVWGSEWLGEYDSGITHPLPDQNICINFTPREYRSGDLLLKSGDGLKFYYRLNGLPGFLPTWTEGLFQNG
jgi:hypothetical protein